MASVNLLHSSATSAVLRGHCRDSGIMIGGACAYLNYYDFLGCSVPLLLNYLFRHHEESVMQRTFILN
ncbi:hypothetical protein E2C01_044835 [Portunus trituberculatus]|uniref:Uncharacterized protein n=1 Tax=Portunus trituberculatus TaxID=210409 RepID=A0A5B7G1J3_PORTR|nr:hypothetical protein [Portunus trituberculatus]